MTGIKLLRDWVGTMRLSGLVWAEEMADELESMADQIERETQPKRDAAEDVSVSAYDLLPADERDAIAWVREHGGLGHVKDICHDFRAVVERLGIEWSESELHSLMDALDRRLMPEGMEWPRFEDGEPVRVGDEVPFGADGTMTVTGVELTDDGHFILHGRDGGIDRPCQTGYQCGQRVKRPAPEVLDADGIEIELGDDLYSVEGGLKFHVSHVDRINGKIATDAMFSLDKWADPAMYTHRAPVIAADGRPLREGEAVYEVDGTGHAYKVASIRIGNGNPLTPTVVTCDEGDGTSEHFLPSALTHERPESKCRDCKYWQKDPTADNMGVCWFYYHEHEGQDCYAARRADIGACEEFMPRAKALAERDA